MLRDHALYLSIVGAYFGAAKLASIWSGRSISPISYWWYLGCSAAFVWAFAVVYSMYVMLIVRPKRPLQYTLRTLRERYLSGDRLGGALIGIGAAILLAGPAFSFFKSLIPELNPFWCDAPLADIDEALHFGVAPWEIIHSVCAMPGVTWAIDRIYFSWFFVMTFTFVGLAFSSSKRQLRMQFLLTFVLSWFLLGNVLATLLSSAGPCYYDVVAGDPTRFSELKVYLNVTDATHTLYAVKSQNWLWSGHLETKSTLGNGISAMPSLHVGIAWLVTLAGFRLHRLLGVVLLVYTGLILVGSVHLGWHYAVDGYVAIAATSIIWHGVGKYLSTGQQVSSRLDASSDEAKG